MIAVASGLFFGQRDEGRPVLELAPVAALAHEGFVDEALGDDDMGQRGQHGDVGAGQQRQVVARLDVRRFAPSRCGAGRSTISLAPWRRRFFIREANTGWASAGLAPMTMIDVGVLDRVEILRAGRGAEGGRQAVAGRRVADARAGIDVVVAEAGADQLLHQIGFFVGAARGGDAADGVAAVLRLDALEFGRRESEGFVPGDFLPGIARWCRGSSA